MEATVGLYEANYTRLLQLVPALRELAGRVVLQLHYAGDLVVEVVERSPYTCVVVLTGAQRWDNRWLRRPAMTIRVCYDARVVEVIAYQNARHFSSRYDYPNDKMFFRHEKRLVNLFLGEWLEHCLATDQDANCIAPALGV